MTKTTELSDFRKQFPECAVVVLADLSTGMVLAADTKEKVAHETLDGLCQNAIKAVATAENAHFEAAFGWSKPPNTLITVGLNSQECFVRADPPAQEALCMRCSLDQEMTGLLRQAADVLGALVGDSEQ